MSSDPMMEENCTAVEDMIGSGPSICQDGRFMLLYVALVSVSGVLLLSLLFISTILLWKYYRRSKDIRYIYQTKPKKGRNGTQERGYSVRSQGILELNSPQPKHHDYVNVFDSVVTSAIEEQPQEERPGDGREEEAEAPAESPADQDDPGYQELDLNTSTTVVYEEVHSSSEELGSFNRQSAIRQSIRSDSGRNVHFTRQSNLRMSCRSESGILNRVHSQEDQEREGEDRGRRLSRRRSERGREGTRKGATLPAFHFQMITSTEDLENSEDPGMQPLSIHQVRVSTPNSAGMLLSDIPGFKDPEIMGGSTDSLEKLKINLPPDIYSSQILRTVSSPEQEDEATGDDDRGSGGEGEEYDGRRGMVIAQRKQSTVPTDNLISLAPRKNPEEDHSDPWEDEVSAREALYDEPVLKPMVSKESHFLEPLFDDPGYNKGLGLVAIGQGPATGQDLPAEQSPTAGQSLAAALPAEQGPAGEEVPLLSGDGEHTYNILEEPVTGTEKEGEGRRRRRREEEREASGIEDQAAVTEGAEIKDPLEMLRLLDEELKKMSSLEIHQDNV